MKTKFIVVDDDYINNELCTMIIEYVFPEASIQTFTDPKEALQFINSSYSDTSEQDIAVFLDINMPVMNGWDFLDAFDAFDVSIKQQLRIFMLSSSVDPRDKKRANANINVKGFFEKPLTDESLQKVVNDL